jgi:trk system potassium uptake protein TrkA
MLAVIVGGGRGGSYLAQDLQGQGYQVKVVDRRPDVVAKLRQEIDGEVLCGDEIGRAHV